MSELLTVGQVLRSETSGQDCKIEAFIGRGGQGEVYKGLLGSHAVAVKWYLPHYLQMDTRLKQRLNKAISNGPPTDKFLWPMELVSSGTGDAFGYVMALREPNFKGIVDMMEDRADPTMRALTTAAFELADNYHRLHSCGLCYHDISFGNVFFDPITGDIRICDNDNVDVNGTPGNMGGTLGFMAPEIVLGQAAPSTNTDLFSLAVLMFYMFHIHHPLMGRKMMGIHCWDPPAQQIMFGRDPVFIFHPTDRSNEAVDKSIDPLGESGANALRYWPIYPKFLQDLFTTAFVDGLKDPDRRVQESIWRRELVRLRDSIFYCGVCGRENFYCVDRLQQNSGQPGACWSCRNPLQLPFRIRITGNGSPHTVMLNHDTRLYPYHTNDRTQTPFDFSAPVAEVNQHPTNPGLWGLKNLSGQPWSMSASGGEIKVVEPGRSVSLSVGTLIHFGIGQGELR